MQRTPLILVLLAAVLFAGCKTKSPLTLTEIQQQALPNIALTNAWKAGGTAGVIQDNWLANFNDGELDDLVREAMTNNPDLRVSATRVEQAEQNVELAKAALRPVLAIAGTGGFKGGGGSDVSSALQGIKLAASWEPDLWGRMRYARNAAQADYASARADFEFARQSLAATTAKSWFTASETSSEMNLAADMVKSAENLVALARANLGNYEDAGKQVGLAHQQALRSLELLLGRYPSAELAARESLPPLPGPVPVGMPLQSLERRPDMIAAERRVAAAFNRVGEAKTARLPRVILNGSVAAIDSDVVDLKPGFENPIGGFGGNLIAPIYTGGALQTQVKIRTIEQKTAVAEYAAMALRAIGDVENALAAGENLAERVQLLDRTVADQQRALELAETSYRVGETDLRSVQQQQLNVYAARLASLRVHSEQLSQRVNLHLVLGGSFEKMADQPTQVSLK